MSISIAHAETNAGYFESLPKSVLEFVRKCILDAANGRNGPEGWKSDDDCLEEIECHSRDGFVAFDHNRGGLQYCNFTDLSGYWGGGYTCAHKGAAKEIQRQIDYAIDECVPTYMAEHIGKSDMNHYFGGDKSKLTYGNLEELARTLRQQGQGESADKVRGWVNEIQDAENENLSEEGSSIMHEIRCMYHGQSARGVHSMSVSAAVNTEGPYHRSSISWAPDVFCEGASEVEIKWRTLAELKEKLPKALAKVCKAVF